MIRQDVGRDSRACLGRKLFRGRVLSDTSSSPIPCGTCDPPPIPESLWQTVPPARGPRRYPGTVRDAGAPSPTWRSGSTRTPPISPSLRPPNRPRSSNAPPAPPLGKRWGGGPAHARHTRPPVPPDGLRRIIGCSPTGCAGAAMLSAETTPDNSGIVAQTCLPPDPAAPRLPVTSRQGIGPSEPPDDNCRSVPAIPNFGTFSRPNPRRGQTLTESFR